MNFPYLLSFRKTLDLRREAQDLLIVDPAGLAMRIKQPGKGIRALIERLLGPGSTEEALCNAVADADGGPQVAQIFYHLRQFDQKGFLCRTVTFNNAVLGTLIPAARGTAFVDTPVDPAQKVCLSRFAFCRNDNGQMVLECPLGHGQLALGAHGMQMIATLASPVSISAIQRDHGMGDEHAIRAFLSLLFHIKALEIPGLPREEALSQWEFHDLLFHTRSRFGRTNHPLGGTQRFLGRIAPLPAVKPPMGKERVALFKPDLATLEAQDPPFTRVLESRRSLRDYSLCPLVLDQVGEFLFRSCRVQKIQDADPTRGAHYQRTTRPWPSGGAMHGLEIYAVVNACDGISPGLYHYDPMAHALETLSESGPFTEKLLDQACMAANLQYDPGILFVVTARFQRVAWKYESIAYALMLKDLGALFQTFYLVATAMKLAPCALGAGDSDLFARAADLDYYKETSIGEFLIGRGVESHASDSAMAP